MTDVEIIELYWNRDQTAISQSKKQYGSYCYSIAQSILNSKEDTEECVNDTWLKAWNAIPPNRPNKLSLFLGKITRNLAAFHHRFLWNRQYQIMNWSSI